MAALPVKPFKPVGPFAGLNRKKSVLPVKSANGQTGITYLLVFLDFSADDKQTGADQHN